MLRQANHFAKHMAWNRTVKDRLSGELLHTEIHVTGIILDILNILYCSLLHHITSQHLQSI